MNGRHLNGIERGIATTDIGRAIGRGVDLAEEYHRTKVFRTAPSRDRVSVPARARPKAIKRRGLVARLFQRG